MFSQTLQVILMQLQFDNHYAKQKGFCLVFNIF